MNKFIFTKFAQKRITNLPIPAQKRILNKMKSLKTHDDIFTILKKLHKFEPATHRPRIGDYRAILELKEMNKKETIFYILDIGMRSRIYK